MTSDDPLVSVVMPVFNADEYLAEAIDSILSQTFRDFEFIIICDDPTDKTHKIIDNYQKTDNRIIVFYQKREGLVASLNKGCTTAKGKYIARMDADDISFPERFEKQIFFLENNKNIGVLGTGRELINDRNEIIGYDFSTGNSKILKWHNLFGSGFSQSHGIAHPTIMMRKELITKVNGYSSEYPHNEDFDLWIRLIEVTNFSNIPELLLKYRFNDNRISLKYKEVQELNYLKVIQSILKQYLNEDIDLNMTKKIIRLQNISSDEDVRFVFEKLSYIYTNFLIENNLNNQEIHQIKSDIQLRFLILSLICYKISKKMSINIFKKTFLMNPLNMISSFCICIKNAISRKNYFRVLLKKSKSP